MALAPRVFLRELVDVLDRVDQHEGYDPSVHYRLDVEDARLTAQELAARQGRPVSEDLGGLGGEGDDAEGPLEDEGRPSPPPRSTPGTAGPSSRRAPRRAGLDGVGDVAGIDRLHPHLQHGLIHDLGWRSLRRSRSSPSTRCSMGATPWCWPPPRGARTEAAFFPLLSRILEEELAPVAVLYLCPIRALLNNQEERLRSYARMSGSTYSSGTET